MPISNKIRRFNDEEAKRVPPEAGAYELLFNGTVVYIGSSNSSIRQRICEHRKRKRFMRVTHFRFKRVYWPDNALDLEAKLCESFRRKNGGEPPRLQDRTPKYRRWFDW